MLKCKYEVSSEDLSNIIESAVDKSVKKAFSRLKPVEISVSKLSETKMQNYQDFQLTGDSNISIGPSDTACVWVEIKKSLEDFKEGQVMENYFQ
ncbi:13543_t:CDS:2 [Ambispora leptoticha]|uniref:13543_t:CDS:1 n=1 Tax=Ambispora leptoticha TaxID=144679 RepID=A0A9N9BJA7_9GLOM|nr:13543_t:CDS:2 [Ambispora leptoticha]